MQSALSEFLKFRTFVTHNIAKFLFWAYTALLLLAYPIMVLGATISEGVVSGIGVFIVGGIGVGFMILMGRIYAELVIVVFGIHDELKKMNDSRP